MKNNKSQTIKNMTGQAPHRASRFFLCSARNLKKYLLTFFGWINLLKLWALKKARIRATAADLVTGQAPHRASRFFLCSARNLKKYLLTFFGWINLLKLWALKKARIRATAADLVTGQAMLIIVMVLGASMLGVATIAGYISLQKIKSSTEIADSTKAIYAADAGVEWCLYNKFGTNGTSTFNCTNPNPMTFGNDSDVQVIETNNVVRAIGHSFNSYRAFGIFLGVFNQ